ncbi:MAG: UDP-N-acetylmuramate dehydrogenase, partial [Verrucomicrobiota bacterium]
ATEIGVDFEAIRQALKTFRGARRRFDRKYASRHFTIIDDYGHHPTEIEATLQTARELNPGRLVCLFQPHRYSRTQRLAEEFGQAFRQADVVFVSDVYAASEAPISGVSGQTIVDAIESQVEDIEVHYLPVKGETHWAVGHALRPGDLLITLGAGDIHKVGTRLAADLEVLEALEEAMGEEHGPSRLYESMARHTTLRVGGPAQYWIEPRSVRAFSAAVRYGRCNHLPIRVVGRGSNLLVKDGGIPGLVIHPNKGDFSKIEVRGEELEAGAGARFKNVAGVARSAGLAGFEWMEGIPGNVGGSLRMNAGAMAVETFDQVVRVTCLDPDTLEAVEKTPDAFEVHYRNVPDFDQFYALSAVFKGTKSEIDEINALMEESKEKRRSSQPVGASAGCIFKNPDIMGAGQLVDELGLKNHRVGSARVSEIHGNFIVNEGEASAAEVLQLIGEIQEMASEKRQTVLETEVQILGVDRPEPNVFA